MATETTPVPSAVELRRRAEHLLSLRKRYRTHLRRVERRALRASCNSELAATAAWLRSAVDGIPALVAELRADAERHTRGEPADEL